MLLLLLACTYRLARAYRGGGGYYKGGGSQYRSFAGARAVDGDTIRTRGGEYVRLRNVDAPELHQRGGHASRAALQEKITHGGYVDRVATDAYGRTVGYVYDAHGNDVGAQQVDEGHGKRHGR